MGAVLTVAFVAQLFQDPLKLLNALILHQGEPRAEPQELFKAEQVPPGSSVELPSLPKRNQELLCGEEVPRRYKTLYFSRNAFSPANTAPSPMRPTPVTAGPEQGSLSPLTRAVGRAVHRARRRLALGRLPVPAPGAGTLLPTPRALPGCCSCVPVRPAGEKTGR